MAKSWLVFVFLFVLLAGCIESGSLSMPGDKTGLDLSSLTGKIKEIRRSPASGEMGIPVKELPGHYLRTAEHGSHSEAFSLKGLPSTVIIWRVQKDPYGREYEGIKARSADRLNLTIDDTEIDVVVTRRQGFYSLTARVGLYTFSSETQNTMEIDSARVYGTHDEVVRKVFEAGLKNAMSFDLESFGD